MKTISVITPIFDCTPEEIERTALSIEAQTDQEFEWIVVFDGLADPSIGIPKFSLMALLQFISITPKLNEKAQKGLLRYVITNFNRGPSVARNIGVAESTGEFITYLDIGDELNPERIKIIKDVLKQSPEIYFLVSGYDVEHPTAGRSFYNPYELTRKAIKGGSTIDSLVKKGMKLSSIGVVHSRKLFYLVGGFQPGITTGEEMLLWRRMASLPLFKNKVFISDFNAGVKRYPEKQNKEYLFGSFDIDYGNKEGLNGEYLDKEWYKTFTTKIEKGIING